MADKKVIWKYSLSNGSLFHIPMPNGAEMVAFQKQDNAPYMWALVNPSASKVTRIFHIVATGQVFDASLSYVGTYQSGPFVWHVLEEK